MYDHWSQAAVERYDLQEICRFAPWRACSATPPQGDQLTSRRPDDLAVPLNSRRDNDTISVGDGRAC
jgi:hypothetical protein